MINSLAVPPRYDPDTAFASLARADLGESYSMQPQTKSTCKNVLATSLSVCDPISSALAHSNKRVSFKLPSEENERTIDAKRQKVERHRYSIGEKVDVNFLGKGIWYEAIVKQLCGHSLYDVVYP